MIGQERFGNMTRVYYREAMGAFIVFDVTRPATFEAVTKWKNDLDSKLSLPNGKPVSVVLLANKCDQGKDMLMNNGLKMENHPKSFVLKVVFLHHHQQHHWGMYRNINSQTYPKVCSSRDSEIEVQKAEF